jgi:hypothetical protein
VLAGVEVLYRRDLAPNSYPSVFLNLFHNFVPQKYVRVIGGSLRLACACEMLALTYDL